MSRMLSSLLHSCCVIGCFRKCNASPRRVPSFSQALGSRLRQPKAFRKLVHIYARQDTTHPILNTRRALRVAHAYEFDDACTTNDCTQPASRIGRCMCWPDETAAQVSQKRYVQCGNN